MYDHLRGRRLETRGRFFLAAGQMFGTLRHLMDENWLDPEDAVALGNMAEQLEKALSLLRKADRAAATSGATFTWEEASEGIWVAQAGIVEVLVRSGPTGFSWFAYVKDADREQLASGVTRDRETAMLAGEHAAQTYIRGGKEGDDE